MCGSVSARGAYCTWSESRIPKDTVLFGISRGRSLDQNKTFPANSSPAYKVWVKHDEVRRTIPIAEGLGLVRVPGIICRGLRLNEWILWFSHGTWAETVRIKCQSLLGRSNLFKAISTKTHSFEICVEFPTAEKTNCQLHQRTGPIVY